MTRQLEVLDLFSGMGGMRDLALPGGWSKAFRERGHRTTTLDYEPAFEADHVRDILEIEDLAEIEHGRPFDVIVASPPCERFSVMTVGISWRSGVLEHEPKSESAALAKRVAERTFDLIERYVARHPGVFYLVENPRGMMRSVLRRPPSATTWYCQWGAAYAKPTDVWTNLRGRWPKCHNGATDHAYAPRGAKTGVQADNPLLMEYATAAARREALLRGEEVPGYKIVPSKRGPNGGVVVRSTTMAEMIDRQHRKTSGVIESRAVRDEWTKDKIRDFQDRTRETSTEEIRQAAGLEAPRRGRQRRGVRSHDFWRAALRALIPYQLALAVCVACETDGTLPPPASVQTLAAAGREA